jgi:hypothetical protein
VRLTRSEAARLTHATATLSVREWSTLTGLTQGEASAIVGGLSSPGKMPCSSYSLPAAECGVGSRLRTASTPGRPTVCGDCYAMKNRYAFPETINAAYRRLRSLEHPRWVDAMVTLIGWRERNSNCFRWHDSGDLQSLAHLSRIVEVARRLPHVRFWLPTREALLVREWVAEHGELPPNLNVRLSAALVGHFPRQRASDGLTRSAVARRGQPVPAGVHDCPARHNSGKCGDCRACWDPAVPVVAYPLH